MPSGGVEMGEELARVRSLDRSLLNIFPLVTIVRFISGGVIYLARH